MRRGFFKLIGVKFMVASFVAGLMSFILLQIAHGDVKNNPPVAVIDVQFKGYMTLNLTGDRSYDPDGDELYFTWVGDEGFYSQEKNPPEFTFTTPGLKTIILVVKDAKGGWDRTFFTFNAREKPGIRAPDIIR